MRRRLAMIVVLSAVGGTQAAQAADFKLKPAGEAGAPWRADPELGLGAPMTRRDQPAAFRLSGARYGLDLSPYAAFGADGQDEAVEAGASVRFGRNLEQRVSDALGGVRDGAGFRDQGRWYIYAAASGKAVGLNMLRGEGGDWRRAGWSSDPAARMIAGAQAGVAWRKGPMQAAFGYLQRRAKVRKEVEGVDTRADSMVAFSFSLTPRW